MVGERPREQHNVIDDRPSIASDVRRKVLLGAVRRPGWASVSFERYSPDLVDILKATVPSNGRSFRERAWDVDERYMPSLSAAFSVAGCNVDALRVRYGEHAMRPHSTLPPLPYEHRADRIFIGPLPYEKRDSIVEAVKSLRSRKFGSDKRWSFPAVFLTDFISALDSQCNDLFSVTAMRELAQEIDSETYRHEEITVDAALLSQLRDYQREGVAFLTRPLAELRQTIGPTVRGMVLADGMGLGKSAQTLIRRARDRRRAGPLRCCRTGQTLCLFGLMKFKSITAKANESTLFARAMGSTRARAGTY